MQRLFKAASSGSSIQETTLGPIVLKDSSRRRATASRAVPVLRNEFLEKRFPESRRKAYYLMAIHENLAQIPKRHLREVGSSKATEMVKVARKDGSEFDCAT